MFSTHSVTDCIPWISDMNMRSWCYAVGHLSWRCVLLKFNLGFEGFYMADVGTGCTWHGSDLRLLLGVSWSGVWLTLLLQYGDCRLGRPEVTLPIPYTALRGPASGWGHPQSSASCIVACVLTTLCSYVSNPVGTA